MNVPEEDLIERGERHLFHHGLEQVEMGRNVFPLDGKRPAIEWKPYQTRRTLVAELARWYGRGSTWNIAIVTGAISDLVVVDCDGLTEAMFWWHHFPQTPEVVKTGRGFHFYYRHPGIPVTNRRGVLGRKIDIRGDGGYVVGAGSIHPDTGAPYVRIDTKSINFDEVVE